MKKEFLITSRTPGQSSEEAYLRGIIEIFFGDPTIYVTYCYREGECYDLIYHVFLEEKAALEYMEKDGYKYSSTNPDGKRQFYQNGVMIKGMLTCKAMDLLDEIITDYEKEANDWKETAKYYKEKTERYRKDTQGVIEEKVAGKVEYLFSNIIKENLEKTLEDTNKYLEKLNNRG